MKKQIILYSLFIMNITLSAQDTSNNYIYKGERQQVKINYNYLYVVSNSQLNYDSLFSTLNYDIENFKEGEFSSDIYKEPQYWKILRITNQLLNITQYNQLISELNNDNIDYFGPVIGEQFPVALSNYFYVKLKNQNDYLKLNQIAEETKCEIIKHVEFMPDWYIIRPAAQFNQSRPV